jgi:hypothetical protein
MRNLVKVEKNLKEVKNVLKKIRVLLLALAMLFSLGSMVFAATDNPITVVNNLSDFMFGLIRAIGMILIGFGVVQIGLSLKSHDASQRANGFMTLAGGVVVTFAKEILDMIVG